MSLALNFASLPRGKSFGSEGDVSPTIDFRGPPIKASTPGIEISRGYVGGREIGRALFPFFRFAFWIFFFFFSSFSFVFRWRDVHEARETKNGIRLMDRVKKRVI